MARKIIRSLLRDLGIVLSFFATNTARISTDVLTIPYYRFYRQNTLLPIQAIARSVEDKVKDQDVSEQLRRWRERKFNEFQLVTLASTLLSAAVIGCFSWPAPETQHWIGPALWYSSLVLSVTAILLAGSMGWILNTIAKSPRPPSLERELAMIVNLRRDPPSGDVSGDSDDAEKAGGWLPQSMRIRKVEVRWNMIFTWQAPMMLMAYSAIAFLAGMTVFVCTPLYDGGGWVDGSKTAIFYLVACGFAGLIFVWCAYWAYRFVDLEDP